MKIFFQPTEAMEGYHQNRPTPIRIEERGFVEVSIGLGNYLLETFPENFSREEPQPEPEPEVEAVEVLEEAPKPKPKGRAKKK